MDRLETLEAAMRELVRNMDRLNEQSAALLRNDERLVLAVRNMHHRLLMLEAISCIDDVASGATKGAH